MSVTRTTPSHARAEDPKASRRVFSGLVLGVAAALILVLTPSGARAQAESAESSGVSKSSTGAEVASAEEEPAQTVFELTNDSRNKHDRRDLALDDELSQYAARHSEWMADRNSLKHTKKLSRPLQGINWHHAGENIGVCTNVGGESCLPALQDAFMRSAGHRANILDGSFDHVATGVAKKGDRYWVTVIFYG